MNVQKFMKRGTNVYGTGVRGAKSVTKAVVKLPFNIVRVTTRGLPVLPSAARKLHRVSRNVLNTGFGAVETLPRFVASRSRKVARALMPKKKKAKRPRSPVRRKRK